MTYKVSVMNEEFVMAPFCGLRRAKDRSIFARHDGALLADNDAYKKGAFPT